MRMRDWSSDVCSSDLRRGSAEHEQQFGLEIGDQAEDREAAQPCDRAQDDDNEEKRGQVEGRDQQAEIGERFDTIAAARERHCPECPDRRELHQHRSEEHTYELQSLNRLPYPCFCLITKIKSYT